MRPVKHGNAPIENERDPGTGPLLGRSTQRLDQGYHLIPPQVGWRWDLEDPLQESPVPLAEADGH